MHYTEVIKPSPIRWLMPKIHYTRFPVTSP